MPGLEFQYKSLSCGGSTLSFLDVVDSRKWTEMKKYSVFVLGDFFWFGYSTCIKKKKKKKVAFSQRVRKVFTQNGSVITEFLINSIY